MGVVNRRNAVLGWVVWQSAKRVARLKARGAVPGRGGFAGMNKPALATIGATILAAIGGVLLFWRTKSNGPAESTS